MEGREGKGGLVRVAETQEGLFPEGPPNELHADGKAGRAEATGKRESRMAGDIEGPGEAGKERPDIDRFASEQDFPLLDARSRYRKSGR